VSVRLNFGPGDVTRKGAAGQWNPPFLEGDALDLVQSLRGLAAETIRLQNSARSAPSRCSGMIVMQKRGKLRPQPCIVGVDRLPEQAILHVLGQVPPYSDDRLA
jgi:hypothetical protein